MGKTNKVILVGNMGDDIKLHHFEGGGMIGRVGLATTEKYKKKNSDEVVEDTEWHNLVFYNKSAELIDKYCQKGSKLYIEGRIKYRQWDGEDGQKKYATEIKVGSFEFLDSKGSSNRAPVPPNDVSAVDAYNNKQGGANTATTQNNQIPPTPPPS